MYYVCALHCSHERIIVWQRRHVGHSRSVDVCVSVDHTSVGLTPAPQLACHVRISAFFWTVASLAKESDRCDMLVSTWIMVHCVQLQ